MIVWGFNPYYDGCSTITDFVLVDISSNNHMFQSLLWWMLYYNFRYNLHISRIWKSFNPYYDGCSTITQIDTPSITPSRLSFNPYYDGCSTITVLVDLNILPLWLFQSLLWWMLYYNKLLKCSLVLLKKCFNPYYDGCSTITSSFD